jgi:hypothetical protein
MFSMKYLRQHPARLRSLTGLTVEQFDQLRAEALPRYEAALHARREAQHAARPRKRQPGAGRRFCRPAEERLLLVLLWLRLYVSYEVLGCWFAVDKSTVCHWIQDWLAPLKAATSVDLHWPDPAQARRGWEEVLQEFPELAAIVDATDQRIRRPKDPPGTPPAARGNAQRPFYTGKKKAHVLRTQIAITPDGQITEVSKTVRGGETNDLTLLRESRTWDRIVGRGMTDSGYQGIQHDCPEGKFYRAHRASRGHPLTPEQRAQNRRLSRVRVRIEHTLAQMKIYQVLAGVYRHGRDYYNDVFRVVAALTNRRRGFTPAVAC